MPDETTRFGTSQITQKTPMWATWCFRVTILLTTAATFIIASDPRIPNELKVSLGVYLKSLDMVVLGLSKMVGVSVKDDEEK